jgi:hypothetical protein
MRTLRIWHMFEKAAIRPKRPASTRPRSGSQVAGLDSAPAQRALDRIQGRQHVDRRESETSLLEARAITSMLLSSLLRRRNTSWKILRSAGTRCTCSLPPPSYHDAALRALFCSSGTTSLVAGAQIPHGLARFGSSSQSLGPIAESAAVP